MFLNVRTSFLGLLPIFGRKFRNVKHETICSHRTIRGASLVCFRRNIARVVAQSPHVAGGDCRKRPCRLCCWLPQGGERRHHRRCPLAPLAVGVAVQSGRLVATFSFQVGQAIVSGAQLRASPRQETPHTLCRQHARRNPRSREKTSVRHRI